MEAVSSLPERPAAAARPSVHSAPRIEDHAMIGDLRTAALVTKTGVIDWLCLPAFDSDACFASILGTSANGQWQIAPTLPVAQVWRRYRADTLILETDFVTATGTLRLIDFMPTRQRGEWSVVCRRAVCVDGRVTVRSELAPKFAFGRAVPRVMAIDGATKLFAGPDALYLRGGRDGSPPPLVQEVTLSAGEEVSYTLGYGPSYELPPPAVDIHRAEAITEALWRGWCTRIHVPPAYRDLIVRSLITLKACIYEPTGGMVAAPTTSLPETPGGVRNWDYRFCWLRDGALAIRSLVASGLGDEARGFFDWMVRAIAGDPDQIQIMYGLRGERRLSETELEWLPGYEGARPVRVGNAAYDQRQLDVYGELGVTFFEAARSFPHARPEALRALLLIARHVAKIWRLEDRGIWEMRGPERSFTASKVAAWAAIDRAIRAMEESGAGGTVDDLRAARATIFEEVCREGYDRALGTFTQYYGGKGVDASLLFIPLSGFLPPDDPRVIGTVAAVERELLQDGLLLRFRPEADVDGLSGDEGVFLACSFWLVGTYQLMGRAADARALFDRVVSTANDVGLFAEEYDPRGRRQLGNFPQAFSHFAMVNAALALSTGLPMAPRIDPVTPVVSAG